MPPVSRAGEPRTWTLTLPSLRRGTVLWRMPPGPNQRVHWREASEINNWFEQQVKYLCMEAGVPRGLKKVRVEVVANIVNEMDRDNVYGRSKRLVDSLTVRERGSGRHRRTGWGLILDDKMEFLELDCHWEKARRRTDQSVVMKITEL